MAGEKGFAARDKAGAAVSILVGGVFGIGLVGFCLALATLVFSGPLSQYLAFGTGVFLLSTALFNVLGALRSPFPFGTASVQDVSIAVLAPAVTMAAVGAQGAPEAPFATAMAVLAASAFFTGAVLWLLGAFELSRVTRLIPFPVGAGFLASSGWLLCLAAVYVATQSESFADAIKHLERASAGVNLLSTFAVGAALLFAVAVGWGATGAVGIIVLTLIAFYVNLQITGIGLDEARAAGYLQGAHFDGFAGLPSPAFLTSVDWNSFSAAAPILFNVVLINTVGFVLNTSGTELATRRDVNMETEMKSLGAANMALAAIGSPAGYVCTGDTVIAYKMGCRGPNVGLTTAVLCLLGFLFAGLIAAHVPIFIAAGLLLFIGASLIWDWLIAQKPRLPAADWHIILAIFVATIVSGILVAIALGLALAVAIFVYNYSRQPVMRRRDDLTTRRSVADRTFEDEAWLSKTGRHTYILELQGFIFFGTADHLVEDVRTRIRKTGALYSVVVDFRHVNGIDPAACAALEKLRDLVELHGAKLAYSSVDAGIRDIMRRWGRAFEQGETFRIFDALDDAVEWIEDSMIALSPACEGERRDTEIEWDETSHPRFAELLSLAERIERQAGRHLLTVNSIDRNVYFVHSGQVSTYAKFGKETRVRVRRLKTGMIFVGFARYFDGMGGPNVVVDVPSVILKWPSETIDRLEREDVELAILLHRLIAKNLAIAAHKNNRLIEEYF
jgi:SulP family sulfate permease